MLKNIVFLFGASLFLMACAQKSTVYIKEVPTDFVVATLGDAAEQAHSELAMLAKLRGQGLEPLLPPPDPSLEQEISITWTGVASGALKEICLQIGYRYKETGSPSTQPLLVLVRGLNRPAYALIEDIAWQIQPHGVIRIDPITKTLTLARTNNGAE